MTQRTVQFNMDFNVENLNTIEELENELSEINEELRQVDVNSEAFKELSKQAQQADGKLRTINESLDGVTGTERAEGLVKLADGLVGAFQVAAGASLIFGEKTSEQLEKVIAKVGGLFAAMDGIKKITEAVSAQNLKFVKSTVDGFKKSAVAAKLFGTTARAAITATGIGALIVGVGLLIANFDKVSAWFKRNFGPIVEGFQKLKNIVVGIGGAIKAAFTGGDIKEGYRQAIETHQALNDLQEEYNEKIEETQSSHERTLELLKLQEGTEQDIIDLEKERNQYIVENLTEQQKLNDLTEEQVEELENAKFELQKLDILQEKLNKKNAEALKAEKEKAAEARERAAEEAKAAQEKAKQEEEAKRLAEEKLFADTTNLYIQREILDSKQRTSTIADNISQNEQRITDINKELLKNNEELIFLQQERQRISEIVGISEEERTKRLENINKAESDYLASTGDKIKNIVNLLTEEEAERLTLIRLNNALLGAEQERIQLQLEQTTDAQEKVDLEVQLLKINKQLEDSYKKENQLIAEMVAKKEGMVEVDKTQLEIIKQTLDTYSQELNASLDLLNTSFELFNNLAENAFLADQERLQREVDAKKLALDEITEYNKEKLDELDEANQDLADHQEELNDLLRDAEGDRYDDILDDLNEVSAQQAANAAEEARIAKEQARAQYQYDLAVWEQEKAYAKGQDDAAKAEKTQAIINGIIQTTLAVVEALPNIPLSIIAGVLGAAGVAVIASQSVPKTPVPPKPKSPAGFSSGGFTDEGGKHEVAGVVHKGEFVIPQDVLRTEQGSQMAATLERMRLDNRRGFQDGGATSTPVIPDTNVDNFDYQRLTSSIVQGMQESPMFVSVVEFRDVESRLEIVEDRSSI